MFLIDDILMAPAHGLLWIFKEIHHAVEEEQANEAEAITAKLSELYMMLETGQMTEAEFDAAEKTLLDRLDTIKERAEGGGRDEEDEEDEEDEMVVIRKRKKL
jgi:Gas vesicle protein G